MHFRFLFVLVLGLFLGSEMGFASHKEVLVSSEIFVATQTAIKNEPCDSFPQFSIQHTICEQFKRGFHAEQPISGQFDPNDVYQYSLAASSFRERLCTTIPPGETNAYLICHTLLYGSIGGNCSSLRIVQTAQDGLGQSELRGICHGIQDYVRPAPYTKEILDRIGDQIFEKSVLLANRAGYWSSAKIRELSKKVPIKNSIPPHLTEAQEKVYYSFLKNKKNFRVQVQNSKLIYQGKNANGRFYYAWGMNHVYLFSEEYFLETGFNLKDRFQAIGQLVAKNGKLVRISTYPDSQPYQQPHVAFLTLKTLIELRYYYSDFSVHITSCRLW